MSYSDVKNLLKYRLQHFLSDRFAENVYYAVLLMSAPDHRLIHSCYSINFNSFYQFMDLLRHLEAVHPRHVDVREDQSEWGLLLIETCLHLQDGLLSTVGHFSRHLEVFLYHKLEGENVECVVIDKKDLR